MATHEANNNCLSCSSAVCRIEKLRSRTELEHANATIQELKYKNYINLENEKSSLVTAIKIIQENNQQDVSCSPAVNKDSHENAEWKQQKRKKRNRQTKNPPTSGSLENQDKKQTTPVRKHVDTKNSNNTIVENKHTPTNVVIAGDSMIKHVNGYKLKCQMQKPR
jgi:hypothetical protein